MAIDGAAVYEDKQEVEGSPEQIPRTRASLQQEYLEAIRIGVFDLQSPVLFLFVSNTFGSKKLRSIASIEGPGR